MGEREKHFDVNVMQCDAFLLLIGFPRRSLDRHIFVIRIFPSSRDDENALTYLIIEAFNRKRNERNNDDDLSRFIFHVNVFVFLDVSLSLSLPSFAPFAPFVHKLIAFYVSFTLYTHIGAYSEDESLPFSRFPTRRMSERLNISGGKRRNEETRGVRASRGQPRKRVRGGREEKKGRERERGRSIHFSWRRLNVAASLPKLQRREDDLTHDVTPLTAR